MRFPTVALALALALPAASALAQTGPASPQAGVVPVTSQTPAATNGADTTAGVTAPKAATGEHMSKSERKAQRKQQKLEEKSAKANAGAAKQNSKAIKDQNKATDAAEKAHSN